MYLKIKFVLCIACLLFGRIAVAQTFSVTIPPGSPPSDTISLLYTYGDDEEARKPLGTYFGYERTAFIIPHSLIGHYGQITSISVFCDSAYNPGNVPLVVYAKEVTDTLFENQTTVAYEEMGAVLTYSNTIPATAFVKNQWVTIPFTTYFTHAAHNKGVEFIFETNANGGGNELANGKFFTHYQPLGSLYISQYWNSDYTPPSSVGVTLSYYCPNVQLTIDSITNCTGTLNKDTILATTDTLCVDENAVLSLSNNTIATGLSYQWQDSLVGYSSFVNILGADSTTLLTSITDTNTNLGVTTWFRCRVKCTYSNDSVYSTVKQITLRNYLNCYCTNLGGGCDFVNTAIDSVAIPGTTLSNGLTGCAPNSYTLYPFSGNTTATLSQGATYNLYTRYNGDVCSSFWIDYNQNGVLETNEWTQICLQSPSPLDTMTIDGVITPEVDSLLITSFTVPIGAVQGKTLMRIRTVAGGNTNDSTTTCTPFVTGETEDYYVTITSPLSINQVMGSGNQITVYPNPANERLTLLIPKVEGMANISIYDMTGRVVIQQSAHSAQSYTIDVSSLNVGVYFIEINGSEKLYTQKFIIAK